MPRVLTASYGLLVGLLACYGLYRYYLVWLYYRVKHQRLTAPTLTDWPAVTIQIPVFNERYVVERAIQSACEVDYPAEQLEVQILDDSLDDTTELIAQAIRPYQRRGLQVRHVRREGRRHFKAGALAEGLAQARGELIAIFDADFLIPKDFLRRAVPFFAAPRVGMVQARWGHLN